MTEFFIVSDLEYTKKTFKNLMVNNAVLEYIY